MWGKSVNMSVDIKIKPVDHGQHLGCEKYLLFRGPWSFIIRTDIDSYVIVENVRFDLHYIPWLRSYPEKSKQNQLPWPMGTTSGSSLFLPFVSPKYVGHNNPICFFFSSKMCGPYLKPDLGHSRDWVFYIMSFRLWPLPD